LAMPVDEEFSLVGAGLGVQDEASAPSASRP
jgi:hypothetical protein